MSIDKCPKGSDGIIAGSTIKDPATGLPVKDPKHSLIPENQGAWGESAVCVDSSTGDHYVLNSAVDIKVTGSTSSEDLRLKVVRLKSQSDDMKSEIAGLKVQIEKNKKTLADVGNSQSDPWGSFFKDAGLMALAFGLVTVLGEDLMHAAMLSNAATRNMALQRMKNEHLKSLGGCAAPIKAQQAKLDLKNIAVGAAVVGGAYAVNSLFRGDGGSDSTGQASGVQASQPLPDLSALDEKGLQALYQTLLTEYEGLGRTKTALVSQKTALENEIVKKGGKVSGETTLDKILKNHTVSTVLGAAVGFGMGTSIFRARYQTYFNFHHKIKAGMDALDAQAKAQAISEIAAGKCAAEPVTVQEPVKAPVTSSEFSTVGEEAMCKLPTALDAMSVDAIFNPTLAGGEWYAYDTGTSTQLVDAPTYWMLTASTSVEPAPLPSVDVSETALKAFTEADFRPYLQYLGQNVSSTALSRLPQELAFLYDEPISASKAQGFWDTYTMPLEAVLPQVPNLVASAYAGPVSAEDIKSDVREINKLYSEKDVSDWNINGYRWALQQYMQGLEAGFRPEVSNLVTLAGKGGVVNRYFEVREIQKSRQATADIESNPRLSWEPKPARAVSFAEATAGYAESSALVAYNQAHPEIAEARQRKIEEGVIDAKSEYIGAFNRANAGLSWKITLMIATGQAVYSMPATATVAAPVAAESASGWGGWQLAGAL